MSRKIKNEQESGEWEIQVLSSVELTAENGLEVQALNVLDTHWLHFST